MLLFQLLRIKMIDFFVQWLILIDSSRLCISLSDSLIKTIFIDMAWHFQLSGTSEIMFSEVY